MQEYAEKFYKSKTWQKCREAFINSLPSKLCNRCNERPGKIVHHKIPITPNNIDNPYITLSFSNLEYLCQECHNDEHLKRGAVRQEVEFDDDGNLIKRDVVNSENIYLPFITKPINKKVYIICGAPGSGKTTYVNENSKSDDIVIDLDKIIMQYTNKPLYSNTEKYIKIAIKRRNEILNNLNFYKSNIVWFIVSAPTAIERKHWKEQLDGTIVLMNTSKEECYRRIENDNLRANNIMKYKIAIMNWFMNFTDGYIDLKISPPDKI